MPLHERETTVFLLPTLSEQHPHSECSKEMLTARNEADRLGGNPNGKGTSRRGVDLVPLSPLPS